MRIEQRSGKVEGGWEVRWRLLIGYNMHTFLSVNGRERLYLMWWGGWNDGSVTKNPCRSYREPKFIYQQHPTICNPSFQGSNASGLLANYICVTCAHKSEKSKEIFKKWWAVHEAKFKQAVKGLTGEYGNQEPGGPYLTYQSPEGGFSLSSFESSDHVCKGKVNSMHPVGQWFIMRQCINKHKWILSQCWSLRSEWWLRYVLPWKNSLAEDKEMHHYINAIHHSTIFVKRPQRVRPCDTLGMVCP